MSLASSCRMRFKPCGKARLKHKKVEWGTKTKIVSITLEPRSIYLLRGAARWNWQHSIPAVERLRYSITFRTLRQKGEKREAA